MTRDKVLEWLKYRLAISKTRKFEGFITDIDIHFIREYIQHYKKEEIHPARIVNSISNLPITSLFLHLDSMMNKLILDFKINVKVGPQQGIQDPRLNISMGVDPFSVQNISFVEEYS